MYRIGQSNDIHVIEKNDSYINLGGVKIHSNYTIISYSDGDIILHALAESIYGALGLGDLGDHFSDNDTINKDISSNLIILDAIKKMFDNKFEIINIDMTIICEKIFLKNYKNEIISSLKKITNCENINVKATRWEEDKKIIQCNCIVLLKKKVI